MIVVVFRAHRTKAGLGKEYAATLERMEAFARQTPGYISHKAFVAEDGERLTLVEWESAKSLRGWAAHADHVGAKRLAARVSTKTIIFRSARWCASPALRGMPGSLPASTHLRSLRADGAP